MPAPHDTAIDVTASSLRASILRGELPAGSRLPPERELAERLGVHRATLRSALARLTAAGLVTPRQGSGYAVRDFRRSGGPDLIRDLVALASAERLEDAAADLLLVRRHLARAVIERLASRPPSERARERIGEAVDALAAGLAGGASIDAIAELDLAVVAAILEATESAVLQLCMNPVASIVAGVPRLRAAIYADASQSVLGWRALLGWLASPDACGAGAVLAAMEARDVQTLARLRPARPTRTRRRS